MLIHLHSQATTTPKARMGAVLELEAKPVRSENHA